MNEKVIGLIRTGGVILLFIIGVFLILKAMGTEAEIDKVTQELKEDSDQVTGSVTYTLWLMRIAIAAILGFAVWGIIQNPKRFIRPAIGIGIFGVIAVIGYFAASDAILPDLVEHPDGTASAHQLGGAGINITAILVVIAIALIVVGSVMTIMRYFVKS